MIVLLRRIDSDEPIAVQRRRLKPDGRKCGKPRSLGPTAGAAAKLDADPLVTQGLVLSEGVETCLTARAIGLRPVWACSGPVANFPVLSGIGR